MDWTQFVKHGLDSIYMTDNKFNLEFNKKLLYYRESVVATVYITIKAKISFAFAVTYTQLMHNVYIHIIWE